VYYIGRAICKLFLKLLGGYTPSGAENIPKKGGVLLAPNHVSYLDPPVVGCGISRKVHFMAKEELFKVPVFGSLIRSVGAFPVRRGTADRSALKRAMDLLAQGKVVCVFPEGTRSSDWNLQPPELGFAMVALKSRAPVIPAAIFGTERALSPRSPGLHRIRVRVVYGKPMTFDDLYGNPSRGSVEEAGRRVMKAIHELLTANR